MLIYSNLTLIYCQLYLGITEEGDRVSQDKRIVRVPLPVELIRSMDRALLKGLGGYQTRSEFIHDAVENLVMELTYETVPEAPEADQSEPSGATEQLVEARDFSGKVAMAVEPDMDLATTVLHAPSRGMTIDGGDAEIDSEPLLGLHNRDYPSLWAAHRLAQLSAGGPLPAQEFYDKVTAEAWVQGEFLERLEKRVGRRLTFLFPTNREKPQSAEAGFQAFAIGTYTDRGSILKASGPLFLWKACQLADPDKPSIGMTAAGYELLEAVDGISLEEPHPPHLAEGFFAYLARFAPSDFWGFQTVVTAIEPGIERAALVERLRALRPDWSDAQANTNTAGYVARSREWGLVKAQQVDGRYVLTDFGRECVGKWKEGAR